MEGILYPPLDLEVLIEQIGRAEWGSLADDLPVSIQDDRSAPAPGSGSGSGSG